MKKSLFGFVAIGALIAGPAMAADLRMPVKAPPAPIAPVASWTGCYIGGNVGAMIGADRYSLAASRGYVSVSDCCVATPSGASAGVSTRRSQDRA